MWNEAKRQRFQDLRGRELEGTLSEAEQTELGQLIQELMDHEAACLAPAIERLRNENEQLRAKAERLTETEHRLHDLLQQKEAYLVRVRALVEEIEAERLDLLARFADIAGEPLQARDAASVSSR